MRSLIALVWGMVIASGTSAWAGSLEVAPTTLTIPSGVNGGVFYLINRGSKPLMAQIEVLAWQQNDGDEQLTPTSALVVSPPMARLKPGQQQTVRMALLGDVPEPKEHAFRLLISELPDPSRTEGTGIQVLLQFSVPVFFTGTAAPRPELAWDIKTIGNKRVLTIANTGTRHVKLSGLTLTPKNSDAVEVMPGNFRYILPGATYQWPIALPATASGKPIALAGRDESDGDLDVTLHGD